MAFGNMIKTIPPYFAVNIIGAIGTFFDVGNWKQNFVDPETYIFKRVEAQPYLQNLQNQTIQPNQINEVKNEQKTSQ